MNVYTIKLVTGEEVLIKTGEVDLEENWYDKSIISVIDPRVMLIDPESGPKGAVPLLSGADETSTDFTPVYKIPTSRIITIQIPSAFVENVYLQQTQKPEKHVSGL